MNKKIGYILRKIITIKLLVFVNIFFVFPFSATALIPSDTYFSNQWYLKKIQAPSAWDINYSSQEIVIAVIDSGVQIDHPDLKDNIWRNNGEILGNNIDDDQNGYIDDVNGWDFVNNLPDSESKFNEYTENGILHGTIVAGVIAAAGNNGVGITGLTWNAQLMSLKALNDKGEGDTRDIIRAIDYATNNGADIINLSFVGYGYSQSLNDAIRRAYNSGIIIVAAAGNEQGDSSGLNTDEIPLYPACHDGNFGENMVIGVSATDALDQKTDFSGYGGECIDISAPGVSFFSTTVYAPERSTENNIYNKYYDGYWSGTSMATPIISGSIALIAATNPSLSREEIISFLLDSSDNINRLNPNYINQLGAGRVNLYKALTDAKQALDSKKTRLLIGPYSENNSTVQIVNKKGEKEFEFLAYGKNFKGRANIASGDVDGDGIDEIITGAGPNGGPQVRIFNNKGILQGQFFAYSPFFRGGVEIACADIDGDGIDEIITGAGKGGGPHVRIFNNHAQLKGQFFAYNKNFRGGLHVSGGDVDGDGVDEIITGAGKGGGPQVRIFDAKGNVEGQFFAYNKNFRGGVKVSVAQISRGSGNKVNIITAPGPGGGPHIIVFDNYSRIVSQFFAYSINMNSGVQIAAADIDYDGLDEIITGAGPGGAAHVRIFENGGTLLNSFYAYEEDFKGGVSVGAISVQK
ncbi:MAG: S8 family serine peptidase [Patescibacteria group bacterium]|nr:S8 family serine peptidase [Patescibacteria group bacterium]